ncbi:Protocadherin alpha-4 [Clonorchis sinensis]|uniref:Protocadherin alpha-4 n=1 Tax=Clonorchis sinensis TaxID=79923 RepID=A0A3R7FMR5_CLOSI|nr:Protocadherin alpha-4 [Clonorchis sinensis]
MCPMHCSRLVISYGFIVFVHAIQHGTNIPSTPKELSYTINEEAEVGSFIGNLKLDAERKFLIPYSQLTHFELYDDSKQNYFRIEPDSGKLFVAARIDRETICPQPELLSGRLAAQDHRMWAPTLGSEEYGQSDSKKCELHLSLFVAQEYWINVIIAIHDINDNQPYFPIGLAQSTKPNIYVVNVSESVQSGHEIPLIGARDSDAGINAVQSYTLRGDELNPALFAVSYSPPFTLNLIVLDELDAERKANYTGEIVACDGGQPSPKCGVQPLLIHVTDINDNKPVFEKHVYEVVVNETVLTGSTVLTVHASDADSGSHGSVRYQIGQPVSQVVLDHFGLDASSGRLYTKKPIDAKDTALFVIPVLAKDGGSVPLIGQSVVRISVTDVNDHAPWIEVRPVQLPGKQVTSGVKFSEGTMWIYENQPVGTNLGLIIVGDEDIGDNSLVECKLQESEYRFYLEHANSAKGREMYSLSANQSFDRESLPDGSTSVQITCSDKGDPTQKTEKSIAIQIIDVNEFSPEFPADRRNYDIQIEEGQNPGTFVFQAEANDLDATPMIHYYLSREAQSLFHIDPHSGRVTTRKVLDRESTPKIRFTVHATDKNLLESDLNSTVANVTVTLTDINDNEPTLVENEVLKIVENRPGFSDLVGQLIAIDKDADLNGTVRYKLLSVLTENNIAVNDTFMINQESGKLFTLRSLDREQCSQYRLHVLAYDLGTPESKNTTQTIIVEVLDENDNKPEWRPMLPLLPDGQYSAQSAYSKYASRLLGLDKVFELGQLNTTAPLHRGQRVCKLAATDADSSRNANLTFHLVTTYFTPEMEGDDTQHLMHHSGKATTMPNYFMVSSTSGELMIGPGLRGAGLSEPGLAEIYLRVSDNGNPPLEKTSRLFIRISDTSSSLSGMGMSGKGLLSYLISSGNIGIALTIVLIFVMCLTSICLIVAFSALRQRSQAPTCCPCCYKTEDKFNAPPPPDRCQLRMHPQLITEDGLNLDGQVSVLGKFYHTPKSSSVFSDSGSLYKWTPEGTSYTIGNFGPPPIYNFSVLNATMDRMHASHTGSDKSGTALLSHEPSCPTNPLFDEHTPSTEIASVQRAIHSTAQWDGNFDHTEKQSNSSVGMLGPNSEPFQNKVIQVHAVTREVDGGSADSGQGASEDEPVTAEGWKGTIQFSQQQPSIHLNGFSPNAETHTEKSSTVGSRNLSRPMLSTTQPNITTFLHASKPNESDKSIESENSSSPTCILPPPPPPPLSTCQPRWQKPLFGNDFGHQNHRFEEFPLKVPSRIARQSATLPSAYKMSPPTTRRVVNYSPTQERSVKTKPYSIFRMNQKEVNS